MPIDAAYADASTYALFAPSDTGTSTVIEAALLAATRQIERASGRTFNQDDEDTIRIYRTKAQLGPLPYGWAESENPYRYGGWTRLLSIDDLVSVTSIVIDDARDGSFAGDTALAITDYELWELNAAAGSEPRPYESIYIPTYSSIGGFHPGAMIQVTGIFGWPAIPATIVELTCRLAALRRNALDPMRSGVRSVATSNGPTITYADTLGQGGSLPQSFLDDLKPYRRAASVL